MYTDGVTSGHSKWGLTTLRKLNKSAILDACDPIDLSFSTKLTITAAFRTLRPRFDATKSAFKGEQETQ